MNKQKGFTLVEGLLIILMFSVIGFAGYDVWNNQQDDEAKQTETVQEKELETTEENEQAPENVSNTLEGWKIYNDAENGISFAHPSDWVITDNKPVTDLVSLTLTSSDFVELEGAYGGTVQGIRVYVTVTDLNSEYISNNEQIVAGSARKPAIYTEVMDIETNGISGISYIVGYEGPRSYTYSYENSGKVYRITLEEISSSTESTFHPYIDIFEQLINTFQLD